MVIESATKYLNGHADLAAGAVAGSAEFVKKVGSACSLYMLLQQKTRTKSFQVLQVMCI